MSKHLKCIFLLELSFILIINLYIYSQLRLNIKYSYVSFIIINILSNISVLYSSLFFSISLLYISIKSIHKFIILSILHILYFIKFVKNNNPDFNSDIFFTYSQYLS